MTRLHRSPLKSISSATEAGQPCNGSAQQRACILARLMCGPVSRPELEYGCCAPSATKRISELRAMGYRIRSSWAFRPVPGGAKSVVTVYELVSPDDRQGDLFGEAPAGTGVAA